MKYLTKEWYELCQRTELYFDMEIIKGAKVYDEALYLRLYKKKEREFVKMQHDFYDLDPRFLLEQEGSTLYPLHKLINGEVITEDELIVYHMTTDEREDIHNKIDAYDMRQPFDVQKFRDEFRYNQVAYKIRDTKKTLPHDLLQQIADIRVFALGYCAEVVLDQLKKISAANEEKVTFVSEEYSKTQKSENIPQDIKESFGFHDCKVTELIVDYNIIMQFDTRGGFTDLNKITFVTAEVIKHEEHIVGSTLVI